MEGSRETVSITRASRPASIATGRRNWSTTRAIRSSSRSNTLRLPENRLQLLAGPLHAHLERRHPRAREPRHFLVVEVLHVLEEERLAVLGREPREGAPHVIVLLGSCGGARLRDAVERDFIAHE